MHFCFLLEWSAHPILPGYLLGAREIRRYLELTMLR
jgi:hypothetical protein